ncbi:MAG TPA: hypothetical protein VIF62_27440 [Labilithrix sp.]
MKWLFSAIGATALVVACSSSSAPAPTCDDTPLPAAGKDCATAGLYSVTQTPRCPDACSSGQRTMNPIDVEANQGTVTFAFDSQDNRTEHVTIHASCKLTGCDCVGANGLHVVFTSTEWFAEGLPETIAGAAACSAPFLWHGTRNP